MPPIPEPAPLPGAAPTAARGSVRVDIVRDPARIAGEQWNALLAEQAHPTPFMRHEYLLALHASGSATPATGWTPRFFLLWRGSALVAACPLYLKDHSYGEYVFDFAWAHAYAQHGLKYYPKALVAVPFTPVPGTRLLARDDTARATLLQAILDWCQAQNLSSLHLLFGDAQDLAASERAGLMTRQQVQFHWHNRDPGSGRPFADFENFLASLKASKRKKIRQERRRVAEAGVRFQCLQGEQITPAHWDFFYRCYERTYLEHGNAPYLSADFFQRMARDMPQHWVLFVARRGDRPIACSLLAIGDHAGADTPRIAWGRYWGALERVDCLHFEACYYQPIEWCIERGVMRFEGGAQGEHKLARALLPATTQSAHWLAHPAFAAAVENFLQQEGRANARYQHMLQAHTPFRRQPGPREAPGQPRSALAGRTPRAD